MPSGRVDGVGARSAAEYRHPAISLRSPSAHLPGRPLVYRAGEDDGHGESTCRGHVRSSGAPGARSGGEASVTHDVVSQDSALSASSPTGSAWRVCSAPADRRRSSVPSTRRMVARSPSSSSPAPPPTRQPALRAAFLAEALRSRELRHPRVVEVIDIGVYVRTTAASSLGSPRRPRRGADARRARPRARPAVDAARAPSNWGARSSRCLERRA